MAFLSVLWRTSNHPQIWATPASRVLRTGFPDHVWMGIYLT